VELEHRRAARRIENATRDETPLVVTDVVLCELVWVLTYSCKVSKPQVVRTLKSLLHTRQLAIASRDVVAGALAAFAVGRGDFADYVIRERARESGSETVLTFDRALLKEEGFTEP
jgi:predicted nucleic-acid-binding protein